ncbi:MAG: alcohol dehydrogenase catalytic domain-containing protein [Chitinivibrionales bacterium]|nr:alcohol dehydrogenase catalytic domain-containing protein [Chitinivibrionales bacterium]
MKAIVLTGIRQMELRDVPDPALVNPTDVLIRMGAVGVCGSDVHYYNTGRIGSQVVRYPFAVGHEGAGVVELVGPDVTRVQPGDRIAIEPAMSCWECDQCTAGRQHTCRKLRFLGCPGQAEGCLSEYIVMPQECCYPIPDTMTLEQAALSEPLSIGVYSVKQSISMRGARIAILGAGPIGLSVLLAARSAGVGKAYVTDRIDDRLTVARALGADWTANPDSSDIVEGLTREEPLLLDAVFECCGEQDAADQALHLLAPGGKLMYVGIPTVDRISFEMDLMRRREVCVQNVRRQVECVQPALDMIVSGAVDVSPLVTHRFAFERTQDAFEIVAAYGDGIVKAMIQFPGMQ